MFSIKEVKEVKTVKVVTAKFNRNKIESLIREASEKEKIKVTQITWNENGSANVTGKPLTQAKQKELEKEAELLKPNPKEGGK